jgi:hydrogenase expression/formation protein HypE
MPEGNNNSFSAGLSCPVTVNGADCITLAHGEGTRATRELIANRILRRFANPHVTGIPDAASLSLDRNQIAFTTDSFVVSPLFFPGGDIGTLAVYGTVNDLVVAGAVPRWLSLALIIEEGLPLATLDQVLDSIAQSAQRCHVSIVTGDTKVVPRGAADGLFITTTGIGEFQTSPPRGPESIRCGDVLIVTGPIGCHGLAVLTAREKLSLEPPPLSDCAPLHDVVVGLQQHVGSSIRAMRDATRGGVSAVLHEWSADCGLTMELNEAAIPVNDAVRGACELLGIDPLHSANEGTMLLAVDSAAEEQTLAVLRSHPQTRHATRIGFVQEASISPVTIQRLLGSKQPVDEPTGTLLPRIC